MKRYLNILIVSSEVAPFAKTGGLADVVGALPKALKKLNHDVRIILPKYRVVRERQYNLREVIRLRNIEIPVGDKTMSVSFKSAFLPDSRVQVYFLEFDPFYNRDSLYINPKTGTDWKDNPLRYTLLCRATLTALKILYWQPDIIHCNDWQTALIPYLLKTELAEDPFFQHTQTLVSIHNLGYQGNFKPDFLKAAGIPEKSFQPMSAFEFYGKFSFLKTGLIYADMLNTVSEKYAEEIQSDPEFGCGMEGILSSRSEDLFGILNGLDVEIWNPEKDKLIPKNFSSKKPSGKAVCKEELCKKCGLIYDPDIPLIGVISRLAAQKGFDLIEEIADDLFKLNMQFVLLGTGEKKYHTLFKKIAKKYPKKVSVHLAFDNTMAHWIEAGADMFLMPSRYEPCGLNQMMSMRYGTVPVVRATGGLADTVIDADQDPNGNGFVFSDYTAEELLKVVMRAVERFSDQETWGNIMQVGMTQDFSWDASAKKYVELYKKALSRNE